MILGRWLSIIILDGWFAIDGPRLGTFIIISNMVLLIDYLGFGDSWWLIDDLGLEILKRYQLFDDLRLMTLDWWFLKDESW